MSEQGITGAANNARVLDLTGVQRTFYQGRNELKVLRGVDLVLRQGEIVALVGPSGSGKSTLLHIAGLLEPPDAGDVAIAGQSCNGMNDLARPTMRREHLGFVYQNHHLLPEFTAAENIILPQLANGAAQGTAKARAGMLLDRVGVAHRASHRPAELSGGEQQRVAFCRALANAPELLLADEPTGNLDPETSDRVFGALMDLVRETGLSALIATHNHDLAARMDRIVHLDGGMVTPKT